MQKVHTPPRAHEHQALIDYDTRKPDRKVALALKLVQMLKRLPACILDLIFRFLPVSQDACSQTHAPVMMSLDEFAERLLIAFSGQVNQFNVVLFAISPIQHNYDPQPN